jgi:hypothetical protein
MRTIMVHIGIPKWCILVPHYGAYRYTKMVHFGHIPYLVEKFL